MSILELAQNRGHLLLGSIRLFNGVAALLVPDMTARRLGVDPEANPAPIYPLRMFGVRTVVLGAELLFGAPEVRRRSLRVGMLVHASDTVAAAVGGIRGHMPPRTAALLTGVSTINTALAVIGATAPPSPRPRRRAWQRLRR